MSRRGREKKLKRQEGAMSRKMLTAVVAAFVWTVLLAPLPVLGGEGPGERMGRDTGGEEGLLAIVEQQGKSTQDMGMAQKIRRAIVEDDSLSTIARNIKIITSDGMVTLRGPVKTEEEKRSIEEKAIRIAGKDKIRNEIDVSRGNEG